MYLNEHSKKVKQVIILIIFILATIVVYPQSDSISTKERDFVLLEKGNNLVGLRASFAGPLNQLAWRVDLRYGIFIQKQINFGCDVVFSRNQKYYQAYSLGPFIKYSIVNKKFSPFLESNIQISYFDYQREITGLSTCFITGGGLEYAGLFNRFGVEIFCKLMIPKSLVINSPDNLDVESEFILTWNYGLRINYYL